MSNEPKCSDHLIAMTRLTEQVSHDREDRAEFRARLQIEMDEIKGLVRATNGRVRDLEKWRTFLVGAFVALSMPAAGKLVQLLSQ